MKPVPRSPQLVNLFWIILRLCFLDSYLKKRKQKKSSQQYTKLSFLGFLMKTPFIFHVSRKVIGCLAKPILKTTTSQNPLMEYFSFSKYNSDHIICVLQIMGDLDSQMQAFEESAELSKAEIVENEKKLAEFEGKIQKDRNEGLFFKNLGEGKPIVKSKGMKEEIQRIKEITIDSAGSKTRRNIYLVLIGLVATGIVDSLISSSTRWQKGAILGVILVGLVSQLIYEQKILSETERTEKEKNEDKKD